jgi:hypothetical protein
VLKPWANVKKNASPIGAAQENQKGSRSDGANDLMGKLCDAKRVSIRAPAWARTDQHH